MADTIGAQPPGHGRKRRTNVRGEDARERILDAAAREFEAHGVAGAQIQRIIDGAGATRGAVHYHFATKDSMARELIAQKHEIWPDIVVDVNSVGLTGIDAMKEMMRRAALVLRDDVRARAAMRITPEVHGGTPGSSAYEVWHSFVRGFLGQGIADGTVRRDLDVREAAIVVVQAAIGVYIVARETGSMQSLEKQLERMWTYLLPGLIAHPPF
ncbi:TetR family transcriptional regulator [uncultured Microbacterium sp.]|uniref:TetR family transcriptional regulator n=1 Tax=uncultured Microbacterium sp. TaxID=191216 RepID=UPI0025E59479|nr:TetR family transcriptional regulator [uncultured Microbacterium sp.]